MVAITRALSLDFTVGVHFSPNNNFCCIILFWDYRNMLLKNVYGDLEYVKSGVERHFCSRPWSVKNVHVYQVVKCISPF